MTAAEIIIKSFHYTKVGKKNETGLKTPGLDDYLAADLGLLADSVLAQ